MTVKMHRINNGQPIARKQIPVADIADFRASVIEAYRNGGRLVAFFGMPAGKSNIQLFAVMADAECSMGIISAVTGNEYDSLTPECPQAHWFEREIAEQWGVRAEGHPMFKPIRFHSSYTPGRDAWNRRKGEILPCVTDFFKVHGEEVHEVAVGPVHAGIIEPGHFRFQCHGEHVFNLEILLGYQHRGIERELPGGPHPRTIHYMETLAGDTTIGHTAAYCAAIEGLSGSEVPARDESIRGIALELERLANHTGDLGALANDVGYLPTASYCGRLRGDFLNLTAMICGNRFGRGLVRPGGVQYDIDAERAKEMLKRIDNTYRDVAIAANLLFETPSVLGRFEETGHVSREHCLELGLVGPAARACGVERDVRFEFPFGTYRFNQIPLATYNTGDVFARAHVRWQEIERSVEFIRSQLNNLPQGAAGKNSGIALAPDSFIVTLVEGWRGEICHAALTAPDGTFAHYKIIDPSFHNWMGLSMALRNQEISDFPLCNKSFNLSYCGHDL